MSDDALWPVTTVDLLRHGACAGGAIIRGSTDSPLSELGWQQMRSALRGHTGWHRILSSPLRRCRDFALDFARCQQLPLQVWDSLRELDFGSWEGRSTAAVEAEDPALTAQFYREPGSITPPGGESLMAARERVVLAWRTALHDCRGQHLLLLTHGGPMRLLLDHLLARTLHSSGFFELPYGCLLRLRVTHTPEGDYPQLLLQQPVPGLP